MPISPEHRRLARWFGSIVVLAILALLFGFGSTPGSANLIAHPWDKLLHLAIFAVLSFGLRLALPKLPLWMLIGLALSIALADELHQFFVPQRQPGWDDGLADAIGVLCGLYVWHHLRRIWPGQSPCGT